MTVKKISLFIFLIFITLFTFNISVFADETDYYFSVDKENGKALLKYLCGGFDKGNRASANVCIFHFKEQPTGKKGANNYVSGLKNEIGSDMWTAADKPGTWYDIPDEDFEKIDKFALSRYTTDAFDFTTPDGIRDALKSKSYATCGGSRKSPCFEWIGDNYCNSGGDKWKDESVPVCAELKKIWNKSSNNSQTGQNTCDSPLQTLDAGKKGTSNITLRILYNSTSELPNITVDAGVGGGYDTSSNSIKRDNNYFYLYPKGEKKTSQESMDWIAQKYVDNNYACDSSLGAFCLAKNDDDKDTTKNWYFELDISKCDDESKYEKGVSQGLGGDTSFYSYVEDKNFIQKIKFTKNDYDVCANGKLFGDDNLTNLLNIIFTGIKILVPIILIILGSIDFIQAIFAQDDSGIKKAQSKFIKRLIIAVVIFLIPSILTLLLTIASSIWSNIDPTLCGIL